MLDEAGAALVEVAVAHVGDDGQDARTQGVGASDSL
jgi:hypothetical protein